MITLVVVQMVSLRTMELVPDVRLDVPLVRLLQLVTLVLMLEEILLTTVHVWLVSMMLELEFAPLAVQAVLLARVRLLV